MKCTGKVISKEGIIAKVLVETSACDSCHACGFGAVKDKKALEVNALNDVGADPDDYVHLEVSGKKVMAASAIIFLIPFLGFIAGFIIGYFAIGPLFDAPTPAGLITGFALLAASYYLVYLLGNKSEFEFVIKEVIGEPASEHQFESPIPR